MCQLIKRLGRAFVSKHAVSRAFETLGRAFEGLREKLKLSREFEKLGQMFVL